MSKPQWWNDHHECVDQKWRKRFFGSLPPAPTAIRVVLTETRREVVEAPEGAIGCYPEIFVRWECDQVTLQQGTSAARDASLERPEYLEDQVQLLGLLRMIRNAHRKSCEKIVILFINTFYGETQVEKSLPTAITEIEEKIRKFEDSYQESNDE